MPDFTNETDQIARIGQQKLSEDGASAMTLRQRVEQSSQQSAYTAERCRHLASLLTPEIERTIEVIKEARTLGLLHF